MHVSEYVIQPYFGYLTENKIVIGSQSRSLAVELPADHMYWRHVKPLQRSLLLMGKLESVYSYKKYIMLRDVEEIAPWINRAITCFFRRLARSVGGAHHFVQTRQR